MRRIALLASLVLLVVAVAAPASAKRTESSSVADEGHKITICHATRSLSNPYVKITIDLAAWDVSDTDPTAHGPHHHAREKDGVKWADKELDLSTEECVLDEPPPPERPVCEWTGDEVDHVIEFAKKTKLWYDAITETTVRTRIPAGTYEVILISSDIDRGTFQGGPYEQPHEQWRLLGTSPSGYSDDLVDGIPNIYDQVTRDLWVTFSRSVRSLTAEHWSVNPANGGTNPNSVVPQAACLTLVNGEGAG
jgi:hypothetical protein